MTLFGKVLVLLNFALSVTILAVALASWSNPVDFTNSPGKDKEGIPPGKWKQNADKLRDAWAKIPASIAAVRDATTSLNEFDRYKDAHAFFKAELEKLRTAPETELINAVKYNLAVPAVAQGNPGHLEMQPAFDLAGKPLRSMAVNEAALAKLQKDVQTEEARYKMDVEEETKLTAKRSGPKGLQQRLVDAQAMLRQANEEADRIEPLWINAWVESELILKRRASLEGRLEELKRAEKATGPALGSR